MAEDCDLDLEGEPITLEYAIQCMNENADKLGKVAAELREERRKYGDLFALFQIAQLFVATLRDRLVNGHLGGTTPLTDAAESFIEAVEVLTP